MILYISWEFEENETYHIFLFFSDLLNICV